MRESGKSDESTKEGMAGTKGETRNGYRIDFRSSDFRISRMSFQYKDPLWRRVFAR